MRKLQLLSMLAAAIALAATIVGGALAAGAPLVHMGKAYAVAPFKVAGSIGVAENTANRTVTVKLNLNGFKPNSRHVMHIHKGLMCEAMEMGTMPKPTIGMGKILVPLGVHTADSKGRMQLTITVKHAPLLDFGHIHVMVHYGPNISTPSNARAVTCADIPG